MAIAVTNVVRLVIPCRSTRRKQKTMTLLPVSKAEGERVRVSTAVVLNKREAFEACEACAEAERALLRAGRASEAARMAALFELIEGRLMT